MKKREAIVTGGPVTVPLSPAVRAGDFIFVSGQVPVDPHTGKILGNTITEQTEAVLKRIDSILQAAGSSLNEVVKTTVFMTDIRHFEEMNKVYRKYFPELLPARSCVEIKLAVDVALEIEAVAYSPLKKVASQRTSNY